MHDYLSRTLGGSIQEALGDFPAVAILGPRQVGKSTLAKRLVAESAQATYLDLELPADRAKLEDPYAFLQLHQGRLVCFDEVQLVPELFPVLRSLIDQTEQSGQYLMLGSASRDLIQQGAESLAGRLAYYELAPFSLMELTAAAAGSVDALRSRGGFPKSYLARSDAASFEWRLQFIRSFLERDIPQLSGVSLPAEALRRLWTMLAHNHSQTLNYSQLGKSLGISHTTVRNWIEILQQTFMVRTLPQWSGNTQKRLVKAPKVYIRDVGILHALLNIEELNQLFGHPIFGASWEGLVVEQLLNGNERWNASYYRTSGGAEVDLVLERANKRIAIEVKASSAPSLSRGNHSAIAELQPDEVWVVAPVDSSYPIKQGMVLPISEAISRLGGLFG